MATEDVKRAMAVAQSIENAKLRKAVPAKPDTSAAVKAFALATITGHDAEGLPVEHSPGRVFDSTENELRGLKGHGVARLATDEEVAASEELSDEEEDPEPDPTDEFAEDREIRSYHDYKKEAVVAGFGTVDPDKGGAVVDSSTADDVDEDSGELEDVSKMKKDDVIAELEKRGYEVDKSAKVDDLRADLKAARDEEQQ